MSSGFVFEDPWWFLLLPMLALAWWWLQRKNRVAKAQLQVPSREPMRTYQSWRVLLYRVSQGLLALATVLAITALARPQEQFVERDEEAEGIDIFLVMDVSTSMLARDFTPDRLEASKAVAQQFVANRPFDRIGLAAFAGESFTQSPLTLDHTIVQTMLGELRAGLLTDGTAMGMGLASAINRLKDSEAPSKVVILLTDGVNNSGYIDPRTAAGLAEEFGIRVYTIGVGSNGQALSPIRYNDNTVRMQYVQVRIDEALLNEIAQNTGGKYFRATDNESLAAIYAEIDRLEKRPVKVNVSQRFNDLFTWVLGFGLLFGLLAGIIRIFFIPRLV